MLLRLSDKPISNFLACALTDIMKHPLKESAYISCVIELVKKFVVFIVFFAIFDA